MAEKLPASIRRENLGSVNVLIATFAPASSANDIDDNDTWATGIPAGKIVGWPIVQTMVDGPQDCTIDAIATDGTVTFGSAANQAATVYVYFKDM